MNETAVSPQSTKIIGWLTALVGFSWMALLALAQPIAWTIQEGQTLTGLPASVWTAVAANGGQTVFLLPPLALAAWLWRSRSRRFQSWFETAALASLLPLFFLPLRFYISSTHPDRAEITLLWQLVGLGAYYLFLQGYRKWRGVTAVSLRGGSLPALLIAPLLMAGWLYAGAFGSVWNLIANLLVGLLFGRVIGWLLVHFLLEPIRRDTNGPGWDIALGSLGVGGALAVAAESFGFGGQILLFLLLMPGIAWPLMGSLRLGEPAERRQWGAVPWLIGLAMAAMLVLADVDELTLLLAMEPTEIMAQLLLATAVTIIISRLIGFILWALRNQTPKLSLGRPFQIVTGLVWLTGVLLLALKPNAGFHRDNLFVILSDQADVSAAAGIADVDQRRQFVYETLTAHANQTQEPLRQKLDRFHIGYRPFYLVNAVEVEGGPLIAFWLGRMDGVDRVLHNPELRPLAPFNANATDLTPSASPPGAPDWNLTMIGADRVWQEFGVRGAGVTLGESDSGVQWDHPELRDSYRGRDGDHNFDWLDAWEDEPAPYDLNGHGTHTTATVVGNNVGVAPDADWFACANLVRNLGSPAKYLACMQFMLAPYPVDGNPFTDGDPALAADVLNNSWGCPYLEGCDPTALQTAVTALRAAGIFVVASAGNDGDGGCSTVKDPISLYDDAFSVGAHDAGGKIAGFSSRGPVAADGSGRIKPDILAPGVQVLSAVPGDSYARYDGTSMAGPHVAGVVALIWSANPALLGDIDATERILTETAVPYDYAALGDPRCGDAGAVPDNAVGYGLVNAYEAVKMALSE